LDSAKCSESRVKAMEILRFEVYPPCHMNLLWVNEWRFGLRQRNGVNVPNAALDEVNDRQFFHGAGNLDLRRGERVSQRLAETRVECVGHTDIRDKGNVRPQLIGDDAGVKAAMQPGDVAVTFFGHEENVSIFAKGVFIGDGVAQHKGKSFTRSAVRAHVMTKRARVHDVHRKNNGEMRFDYRMIQLILSSPKRLDKDEILPGQFGISQNQ
jgi:hypothetical protein